MHRKNVAIMIVISLIITLLSPIYAPEVSFASADVLQFQDNFSGGMSLWNGISGSWGSDNSSLMSVSTNLAIIEPKGNNSVWQDQTVALGFQMVETTANGFIGVYARYINDTSNLRLMVRPTGINYKIGSGAETRLCSYAFATGSSYDIKITISGSLATVYVKTGAETAYTTAGTITGVPVQSGKIRLMTYGLKAKFYNVKVWNLHASGFIANGSILTAINVGSNSALPLANITGKAVIWTSENTSLATVDQSGVVTGVNRGLVTIVAATSDNSDQARYDIYVQDPVDIIGVLQFQDDFCNGMNMWNTAGGAWGVANSRLTSTTTSFSQIELKGNDAVWRNQTVSLRFNRMESAGGDYIGIKLRYVNNTDYIMIMIRGTGINYLKPGSGEQALYPAAFKTGVDYDIKLVAIDNLVQVYVKGAADSDYTVAGAISNVSYKAGKIQLVMYNVKAGFDDVKVWNNDSSAFILSKRLTAVAGGDSEALQLANATGKSVVWTSNNNNVATVDQNGVVTANAKGLAVITAATVDGTYQDKCDVVVYIRPTGITLNTAATSLYVGEVVELTAAISPSDVDNQSTIWTASDDSVVALAGSANKARAIKALGTGTATVNVTTVDGGFSAECLVTVNPTPAVEASTAEFQVEGPAVVVPPYIYGVHYSQQSRIFKTVDYNPISYENLLKDIKVENIRNSGEFYLFQEGKVINSKDPRYAGYYGTRTLASIEGTNPIPGYPYLYLPDIYKMSQELEVPEVMQVNVSSQSIDTILEEVRQIKTLTTSPIYIELGNEIYSILFDKAFPGVDDYTAKCRQIYQGIKQIDPSIKVGIVACDKALEDDIKADPNNQITDPDIDMAATQAGRVLLWNDTLAADTSFYDAVIVHTYSVIPDLNGLTANEMMKHLYTSNQRFAGNYKFQAEEFPGKEIWVTEYGSLPMTIFAEPDPNEKARKQFMKTPGFAMHYMERLLQMIDSGKVTISNFHYSLDPQGFGIAQPSVPGNDSSLTMLPNYYVFKALGELLDTSTHYYKMKLTQGEVQKEKMRFVAYDAYYNVSDADAWGFGDVTGVKKIVFANRTKDRVNVSVPGSALKTNWIYGGDEPLPDYLTNPNQNWTDAPQVNPLPETPALDFTGQIQLKPYSMTIVDVLDVSPPAWPSGKSLTALNITEAGLTLTWPAAADNTGVTGYRIYENGVLIDTVAGNLTSYNITNFAPNVPYTFKVEAGDAAGNWSGDGPDTVVNYRLDSPVKIKIAFDEKNRKPEAGEEIKLTVLTPVAVKAANIKLGYDESLFEIVNVAVSGQLRENGASDAVYDTNENGVLNIWVKASGEAAPEKGKVELAYITLKAKAGNISMIESEEMDEDKGNDKDKEKGEDIRTVVKLLKDSAVYAQNGEVRKPDHDSSYRITIEESDKHETEKKSKI